MLKDAVDFAKQVLTLTRKTQQHEEDVKTLQQEMKEVRQELRALAAAMQKQQFEQQRDRDNSILERENLLLRLELLLRSDRQLPSIPSVQSPGREEEDALRKQVEALQNENAELRRRLEQNNEQQSHVLNMNGRC